MTLLPTALSASTSMAWCRTWKCNVLDGCTSMTILGHQILSDSRSQKPGVVQYNEVTASFSQTPVSEAAIDPTQHAGESSQSGPILAQT